ncbi:hypothetical protein ACF5FN_000964, partial [Enterobacter chengduensis]
FVELALLFKITDEHFFNADVAVLIQLIFFAAVSALMRLWLFPKKYYDKKNCSLSVSPSISNNGITSFFVKQLWNY